MERLTKTHWLNHGLQTLAQSGFTALKADKLAKSLGVSRGSFYWHFKNLSDFHQSILARWQQLTVAAAIEQLNSDDLDGAGRIRQLIQLAAADTLALERAVRAWAESAEIVRAVVQAVDDERLAYLESVFVDMGLSQSRAYARGRVVYYAFLGQMVVTEQLSAEQQAVVVAELIDLVAI